MDRPQSKWSMSNFDHVIERGMETDLRNGLRSHHAAWEFYAYVWFEGEQFHSQVMRYCEHVATMSAPTLDELMRITNAEYGDA